MMMLYTESVYDMGCWKTRRKVNTGMRQIFVQSADMRRLAERAEKHRDPSKVQAEGVG
jgi:hypothetical protein